MTVFDQILSTVEPNETAEIIVLPFQMGTNNIDPRSDLALDHRHWVRILTNAQAMYDEDKIINNSKTSLFKILHGLRCGGAKLEETKQSFKLHPGTEDWVVAGQWDKVRHQWLAPVKVDLAKLFELSKFGEVTNNELPPGLFEEKEPAKLEVGQSLFK